MIPKVVASEIGSAQTLQVLLFGEVWVNAQCLKGVAKLDNFYAELLSSLDSSA